MLTIGWEYLLGRLVAREVTREGVPEWPPHPDRLFEALVATWGAGGCSEDQRVALEWLASLPPPAVHTSPQPSRTGESQRAPTAYVPINDVDYTKAAGCLDDLMPLSRISEQNLRERAQKQQPIRELAVRRFRTGRSFARMPVDGACYLCWNVGEDSLAGGCIDALAALCRATPSVGHSSSLVRMWVTAEAPPEGLEVYQPDETGGDASLRVPTAGRLDALRQAHEVREPAPWATWQRYRRIAPDGTPAVLHSAFSPELIVLKATGPNARMYGLAHAPALADVLRRTLMAKADGDARALSLLSGHDATGAPLAETHCAFVPLPFVGSEFADGHILGMAMVLPSHIPRMEADGCARALARALDDNLRLRLLLGKDGTLDLEAVDLSETRANLQAVTWCSRDGAQLWATVTPIVLDMMPPRRHEDRDAFALEQINLACERVGLPAPSQATISPVSRFVGAPHCRDFPPMHRKPDGARRWHVHAVLSWDKPVRGPVLLGAGRFRGMGLLRPLNGRSEAAS